jgi:F0F1-type ATP synthase delta subunit
MTGISTLIQKEELKNCLDVLKATLFEKKNVFEKTLENKVQSPYKELIKARMDQHSITYSEPARLKEFIDNLISEVKNLKVMNLTLAFKPEDTTFTKINSWIEKNLKTEFVYEIKIDPAIIGGAIISARGRYIDQSLRRKIKKISLKNYVKEFYGDL